MHKRIFKSFVLLMLITLLISTTALAKPHGGRYLLAYEGNNGQAGTTLETDKTAVGFWVKKTAYDWTLKKWGSPVQPVIRSGQSFNISYTVQATRTLSLEQELVGVTGYIKVKNGGERPTEGLKIVDQVQYKTDSGAYVDLPGAVLTIIPTAQLQPGETKLYPYEINFTPVPGATYRNTALVTITNHSGYLGVEKGPTPKADFTVPASPVSIVEDDKANVTDSAVCPAGFTCTPSETGPWTLTGSQTINYTVNVSNVSAAACSIVSLPNIAKLTESTTQTVIEATYKVSIFTGCCVCQAP